MADPPTTTINTTTTPPSRLVVILDIHPLSWSLLGAPIPPSAAADSSAAPPSLTSADLANSTSTATTTTSSSSDRHAPLTPLTLTAFTTSLLVFLSAHLASRWGNQVVLYAAGPGVARLLYPSQAPTPMQPNAYHPFRALNADIEQGLKEMPMEPSNAIVSALSKALCYIQRHPADTRIMVVNATPGPPLASTTNAPTATTGGGGGSGGTSTRSDYVGLMNCVFAAQKAKIPIDVLSLPPPHTHTAPPIFLQQASHLTEGVWWRWNGRGGLLQYLHSLYLVPPALRESFAAPPQDAVDFRAVCFCHGDVLDVGFVCSVCLSIFCKPLPVCQMCKTKFPLKAIPALRAAVQDLEAVPVPNTIAPPVAARKDKDKEREREREREGDKQRRREIVVE